MGPAVVLGQDLAEAARPVGNGLTADLAACHRKMGHGHREAAGTRLAHLGVTLAPPGTFPGAARTSHEPDDAVGGMSAHSGGHVCPHKYPGHAHYRAVDAHAGWNAGDVTNRQISARLPAVLLACRFVGAIGRTVPDPGVLCICSPGRITRGGRVDSGPPSQPQRYPALLCRFVVEHW